MPASELPPPALPDALRESLPHFCSQLQERLGDQLISVVLYGGVARGEYAPRSSDVNVMIVVKDATVEVLDRVLGPVQQAVRELRLAPMVLAEEDLRGSTDVFPTKFLEMQAHYCLLHGKDVLADLEISREHLRLRCEQEIKNLLLRLRQFYLQRAHLPERVEATMAEVISPYLSSLSVLIALKVGNALESRDAVVQAAGELGLDGDVLGQVLALKAGTHQPDAEALKRLYGALMSVVQQAARIADRL